MLHNTCSGQVDPSLWRKGSHNSQDARSKPLFQQLYALQHLLADADDYWSWVRQPDRSTNQCHVPCSVWQAVAEVATALRRRAA